MGSRDLFRATEYKESADAASRRVEELEALLTPEHRQLDDLKRAIAEASSECATARAKRDALDAEIADARAKLASLSAEASRKKRDIWDIDEQVLVQEFGLYQPRFDFQTVDAYKAKISHIRARERDVIKRMNEEAKHANWHVNNSVAEGRKMVGQFTRLLMRAYNSECDELVRRVKFSNIERTIDQIGRLAVTIEKQGTVIGLRIPPEYVSLKQDEARLSYEYACFKEEEKERAREERERRREEMALKREIAEKRKKLKKERELYANALRDLDAQIGPGEPTGAQAAKRAELVAALGEVDRATKDVDYREANQRAGYVYVISNIGSFGEGVYKIGMTRRLDPQERCDAATLGHDRLVVSRHQRIAWRVLLLPKTLFRTQVGSKLPHVLCCNHRVVGDARRGTVVRVPGLQRAFQLQKVVPVFLLRHSPLPSARG